MALTSQIIVDGPRRVVVQGAIEETGGDLADEVLLDLSALTPAPTSVTIERAFANLSGFSMIIETDQTTDSLVLAVADSDSVDVTFKGNLQIPGADGWKEVGSGGTGDIVLTTTGVGAGDAGTVYVVAKKEF